ncbi:probable methyltransferase At1g29790 [Argentina anserina]|uniref:probable methyltransferase At1g29790 n=1 Tax=Argentina anserina TaxID=57926 RepID=UPI002176304D|nr:probable methyltransferase At1g29790 [Potentilla anserina]
MQKERALSRLDAFFSIQLGHLLEQLHNETEESKAIAKFSEQILHIAISLDKIAVSLAESNRNSPSANDELSHVDENFSDPEEDGAEEQFMSGHVFKSGEIFSYISPKPNRLVGNKNFLGVEALTLSVGFACAKMASNLDRFMSYKVHSTCPDDWQIAQKLIVHGCDPLPRRDASQNHLHTTLSRFLQTPLSGLNLRGWDVPTNEAVSAEFTIDEVLSLKPGEIRIGLDFSPTTGTFAAVMREKNVTIASSTLNLGAPFNEVIALRGLLPLYTSIGSRLPFFDNTLDIIHSTLFLDGWIGIELHQFVQFDWDHVLRPKCLLWIDRFFCHKEDMKLYLEEFNRLRYKPLLWRVVPKNDKLGDELFFSAVMEKPVRS